MSDDPAKRAWISRVLGVQMAETASGSPAAPAEALRQRLARLEPAFLRVMKHDPPERTKLSALMALANENLDSGALDKTATAMDGLEKLLAASGGAAARPVMATSTQQVADVVRDPGQLVAYRKALLRWETARKQARGQLEGLRSTIGRRAPALADAATVLDTVMDRLNDDLSTAIDAALNARDDSERANRHEQASSLARDCLTRVYFDPVFARVDKNPVAPLTVRDVLGGALKELVAALPQ